MCPGEMLRKLYAGTEMENSPDFDRGGHIVEFGNVRQIFEDPQHPYTKGLVACRPTLESRSERLPTIDDFLRAEKQGIILDATDPDLDLDYPGKATKRREDFEGFGETLIEVKNLRTWFPIRTGVFQRISSWIKAVDDVSITVKRGQTLGLVGESGCGKTTLGRTLLRLEEPREGSSITYEGKEVTEMSHSELMQVRRKMQIIFQDPYSSLNPRLSIAEAITEPMIVHRLHNDADERRARAEKLMEWVGLKPEFLDRYPHEFSGGQRQRICIARSLAVEPEFIVCDESVSALDVSIQAGVINLLLDLQDELGLTYIFISHDLGVVKYVSDVVAVMCSDRVMLDLYEGAEREKLLKRQRGGHIVEMKEAEALYENPEHPYTRKLLEAIPKGEVVK
jgi:peptide/nickel transport system ATP-binding protein